MAGAEQWRCSSRRRSLSNVANSFSRGLRRQVSVPKWNDDTVSTTEDRPVPPLNPTQNRRKSTGGLFLARAATSSSWSLGPLVAPELVAGYQEHRPLPIQCNMRRKSTGGQSMARAASSISKNLRLLVEPKPFAAHPKNQPGGATPLFESNAKAEGLISADRTQREIPRENEAALAERYSELDRAYERWRNGQVAPIVIIEDDNMDILDFSGLKEEKLVDPLDERTHGRCAPDPLDIRVHGAIRVPAGTLFPPRKDECDPWNTAASAQKARGRAIFPFNDARVFPMRNAGFGADNRELSSNTKRDARS